MPKKQLSKNKSLNNSIKDKKTTKAKPKIMKIIFLFLRKRPNQKGKKKGTKQLIAKVNRYQSYEIVVV